MRRYLETLFRHKRLFLIATFATPVVAIVALLSVGQQYKVSASIWVKPSPILDPVARSRATPSEIEAQALRERLYTAAA